MAAGTRQRFGATQPKQYLPLLGRPVMRHAAEALLRRGPGGPPAAGRRAPARKRRVAAHPRRPARPAPGRRAAPPGQASVRAGLEALAADPPAIVLVHDAARPVIPPGTIAALRAALAGAPGAIPAQPVTDTLKRGADGPDHRRPSRARACSAPRRRRPSASPRCSPPIAPATASATDDAALLEAAGLPVALVAGRRGEHQDHLARGPRPRGSPSCRPPDPAHRHRLRRAPPGGRAGRWCCAASRCRIRFGLEGHSDADVGIHALCDAIYGALAEGDIGRWFPPSEAQWKDADSARFLRHAAGRIAARGGVLANADVTLICERPKITPHARGDAARLAELLGVPSRRGSR